MAKLTPKVSVLADAFLTAAAAEKATADRHKEEKATVSGESINALMALCASTNSPEVILSVAAMADGMVPTVYVKGLRQNPLAGYVITRAGLKGEDAWKWWRSLTAATPMVRATESGVILQPDTVRSVVEGMVSARAGKATAQALAALTRITPDDGVGIRALPKVESMSADIRADLIRAATAGMTPDDVAKILGTAPVLKIERPVKGRKAA